MKFKFKAGDILVCKENYDTGYGMLFKDVRYEVISSDYTFGFYVVVKISYSFEQILEFYEHQTYDYFYTDQELRENKLKQLNSL